MQRTHRQRSIARFRRIFSPFTLSFSPALLPPSLPSYHVHVRAHKGGGGLRCSRVLDDQVAPSRRKFDALNKKRATCRETNFGGERESRIMRVTLNGARLSLAIIRKRALEKVQDVFEELYGCKTLSENFRAMTMSGCRLHVGHPSERGREGR